MFSLPGDPGLWFRPAPPRRRPRFREWMALSVVCWSLLGQGEACRVDPRFRSPSTALATYWEALRSDDTRLVTECFAAPALAVPRPGMVWFLPPSSKISVMAVRYTAGDNGRVIATYEVRFQPEGSNEELKFVTGSELVRVHGQWRLVGLAGDVAWPEWKAIPRAVDM